MIVVSDRRICAHLWLTGCKIPLGCCAVRLCPRAEAIIMDQWGPAAYASRNFTDAGTTCS